MKTTSFIATHEPKFPRWRTSTAGAIWVSSFHFIAKHFISKLTFLQDATCLHMDLTFRKPCYKMYSNSDLQYSSQLVPHSTRMNLGLTQIITVILLIATIIGTCQCVPQSNLKIKPKYYALPLKPRIKFLPKIKFKSDILTHLYLSGLIALSGDIHPNPGPYGRPIYPCVIETMLSSAKNVINGTIYIVLVYPHHPTTP